MGWVGDLVFGRAFVGLSLFDTGECESWDGERDFGIENI